MASSTVNVVRGPEGLSQAPKSTRYPKESQGTADEAEDHHRSRLPEHGALAAEQDPIPEPEQSRGPEWRFGHAQSSERGNGVGSAVGTWLRRGPSMQLQPPSG